MEYVSLKYGTEKGEGMDDYSFIASWVRKGHLHFRFSIKFHMLKMARIVCFSSMFFYDILPLNGFLVLPVVSLPYLPPLTFHTIQPLPFPNSLLAPFSSSSQFSLLMGDNNDEEVEEVGRSCIVMSSPTKSEQSSPSPVAFAHLANYFATTD